MSLKDEILDLIARSPGLTDREITDQIRGKGNAQQAVNTVCRFLDAKGKLIRSKNRSTDNFIGNYPYKIDSAQKNTQAMTKGKSEDTGKDWSRVRWDMPRAIIKDITALGILAGSLIVWAARRIVMLTIILTVVLGAGSELINHILRTVTFAENDNLWQGFIALFWGLTDRWQVIFLIFVFFWTVSIRQYVKNADNNAYASKLGMVTLLDYFNLELETDAMKKMHDEDSWSLVKQGFSQRIAGIFVANMIDDAVTARAMRNGMPIKFKDDLRD